MRRWVSSIASSDPTPRKVRADGGFTIMELLVALAILALVVAMIPQALRMSGQATAMSARVERQDEIASVRQVIESRLRGTLALVERDGSATALLFTGRPDAIRFVSPSPTGPAGGGVYVYRIEPAVDAGDSGAALVQSLYRSRRRPDDPVWSRKLLPPGTRVSFRYFGTDTGAQAPGWTPAWRRRDALPQLIEVVVADVREGRIERAVVQPRSDRR